MICHNEEKDIDSIVGQFCSQQDLLKAEIDIISLGFTEEDLGILQHHENDKSDTLPQLPKNVQNNIVNPYKGSATVITLAKSFKKENIKNKNLSKHKKNDKKRGLPLARKKLSILDIKRQRLIIQKEEEELLCETFSEPLSCRKRDLIQRAFVLGAVKAHSRSKKSEGKRKIIMSSIVDSNLNITKEVDVDHSRKLRSLSYRETDICPVDIEWDFSSYELPILEENPLIVALLGMDEDKEILRPYINL